MKVKFFLEGGLEKKSGWGPANPMLDLEGEINIWFKQNPDIKIIEIKAIIKDQSVPSVLIMIFYTDN